MFLRSVPIVRAVWFLKLVGHSSTDTMGMGMGMGMSMGGPASGTRTSTPAQRAKVWTEELKKAMEAISVDIGTCWRTSSHAGAAASNIGYMNEEAVYAMLHTGDAVLSNMDAKIIACGLELQQNTLVAPTSSPPPMPSSASLSPYSYSNSYPSSSPSPPSSASSATDRWHRASSRWHYMSHFLEYAMSEGILTTVSVITFIIDHIAASAPCTNASQVARFVAWTTLASRTIHLLAFSRQHARRLFAIMRNVHRTSSLLLTNMAGSGISHGSTGAYPTNPSTPTSSSISSPRGSSPPLLMLPLAAATLQHLASTFLHALVVAMPNSARWLQMVSSSTTATGTSSNGASTNRIVQDSWRMEWMNEAHDDDAMDGDGTEYASDDDYFATSIPFSADSDSTVLSPAHLALEEDIDFVSDAEDAPVLLYHDTATGTVKQEDEPVEAFKMESEYTSPNDNTFSMSNGLCSTSSHASSASLSQPFNTSSSLPSSYPPSLSTCLLPFSGLIAPTYCPTSLFAFFPRLLSFLSDLSSGHILTATGASANSSSCSLELSQLNALMPNCILATRSVSLMHPKNVRYQFANTRGPEDGGGSDEQAVYQMGFDPQEFIAYTSASSSSLSSSSSASNPSPNAISIFHRYLHHLASLSCASVDFAALVIPILVTWAIRGVPRHDRTSISIMITIIGAYWRKEDGKSHKDASSPFDVSSPLGQTLLTFLLTFRPRNFIELSRVTQLYSYLSMMHVFPYRAFVHHLLTTGLIRHRTPHFYGNSQVDLADWSSIVHYYLIHLPIPHLHTISPTTLLTCILPSQVIKEMRRVNEEKQQQQQAAELSSSLPLPPSSSSRMEIVNIRYATLGINQAVRRARSGHCKIEDGAFCLFVVSNQW